MKYMLLLILLSSCAVTNIKTKALPYAKLRKREVLYPETIKKQQRRSMKKTILKSVENRIKDVNVIQPGMSNNKPLFCFAEIFASSTPASTNEDILNSMIEEAARLNADVLLLGNHNLQNTGSVTTYGSGIAISQNTHRVDTYAQACDYSKVSLGISTDQVGKIVYVKKDSTAEDIGLKENMQLVAINGKPVSGSVTYVLAMEINSRIPGDKVLIEFLDLKSRKVRKEVVLKPFK